MFFVQFHTFCPNDCRKYWKRNIKNSVGTPRTVSIVCMGNNNDGCINIFSGTISSRYGMAHTNWIIYIQLFSLLEVNDVWTRTASGYCYTILAFHFCNWRNVITLSRCEAFHSVFIFVKYSPKIQSTFDRKIRLFIHKIYLLMFVRLPFEFILKCSSVKSISQINFATTISILVLFALLCADFLQGWAAS